MIWSLSRGGPDAEFVAAAAASLARLDAHRSGARSAGACLYALALQEAMVGGSAEALAASLPGWTALARRWGGAAPAEAVTAAVDAAARIQTDPAAVRARWAASPAGELAAGLVAATIGVPSSSVPPSLLETLAALDGF